jgi:hypothetical protein
MQTKSTTAVHPELQPTGEVSQQAGLPAPFHDLPLHELHEQPKDSNIMQTKSTPAVHTEQQLQGEAERPAIEPLTRLNAKEWRVLRTVSTQHNDLVRELCIFTQLKDDYTSYEEHKTYRVGH